MAIINLNLDLDKIDKTKVVQGKKGRYLDVTVMTFKEADPYGKNVTVYHKQSKEEYSSGAEKKYLGKGTVIAGGEVVKLEPQEGSNQQDTKIKVADDVEWDFL